MFFLAFKYGNQYNMVISKPTIRKLQRSCLQNDKHYIPLVVIHQLQVKMQKSIIPALIDGSIFVFVCR